ncbi:MAG: hydantoinase/oxoprolinase family protein [Propylenella sp.]
MIVLGWDIGGAHLKGARAEDGRVTAAVEVACPLWQGLEHLDRAFAVARASLGDAPLNAVTMTAELCDLFASRAEGVARLCEKAVALLPGKIEVYAGNDGWAAAERAAEKAEAVASANWHATASLTARGRRDAFFIDMGSTTTDIVPIVGGRVASRASSDAERLACGELVYMGVTRTFLMAVAQRVPFRGAWTPVMAEYFASMADVYRVLGILPEGADLHATADGREKSWEASAARLARMIGRDAGEAEAWEWRRLADFYAEAQLRALADAAMQVLSSSELPPDAPVAAAGTGRFVVERLAARLDRECLPWESDIQADAGLAEAISAAAPAVAVAMLLSANVEGRGGL